ncbi:hypothetical protein SAMN06272771_6381 [Streptomyces sp. Ag82_O1-12]|nr:hypothetical protein SAMN06272771_6381 [Streptomyces sp. Ag82_O1-12]SOD48928.1 hypothetical protein SAMN06272727_6385 [Streptomyces sp. Ag82_G6-1]
MGKLVSPFFGSVTGGGVSIQTYDLKGRPEYGESGLPEGA